ncbi:hypothetical protein A1O7_06369 [Cladophialophora yegresii CBS 114405]|uniref:Uncharacterized protein n=1 Tax=Cladophialophora yegresii CBS 114405 TaxID=1182544 RepID=W9VTR2_9EURO|nr:uncharacterized protein A1O7_06369 [Cladophialophora yegresii CBS 114405]EXJ58938.1 hypothetical protein A1O7_06369 [Cladophialophora yegresii CBS 114405]
MAAALESRRPVVPMPQWSNIIGCARAIVAILVLAFTAAATGIWGGAPGFGIALFTAGLPITVEGRRVATAFGMLHLDLRMSGYKVIRDTATEE